jgi:hypothetical protein
MKGQPANTLCGIVHDRAVFDPALAVGHFDRQYEADAVSPVDRRFPAIANKHIDRPRLDDFRRHRIRGQFVRHSLFVGDGEAVQSLADIFLTVSHGQHERRPRLSETDAAYLDGVRCLRHAQSVRGDGGRHVVSEFDTVGLSFERPNRRIEVNGESSDGIVRPTGFHADLSRNLALVEHKAHARRVRE